MILYNYYCNNCNTEFEDFESLNRRDNPHPCPNCSTAAQRVISTPTIKLPYNDPAYTTAWDKWDRQRTQKHKLEEKKLKAAS